MRKIWACVWCLVVAPAALVAVDPDVSGADPNCDDRDVCVWQDANFTGCFADLEDTNGDWNKYAQWDTCPGSPSKQMTSYRNRFGGWVIFFAGPDGSGRRFCVAPGASGNVPPEFNDKIQSHAWRDPDKCAVTDRD